jgi:hypothetical protein
VWLKTVITLQYAGDKVQTEILHLLTLRDNKIMTPLEYLNTKKVNFEFDHQVRSVQIYLNILNISNSNQNNIIVWNSICINGHV